MLILTRKPGDTIRIGSDIEVTLLTVEGNQVHLGVQAPPEVAVHREEVLARVRHGELTALRN